VVYLTTFEVLTADVALCRRASSFWHFDGRSFFPSY
jgi:hypothetical protein